MKSVLLIGMGKFGQTLGERLPNMGDEVMIVDKNEDIVNTLAPKYTNALIANCMNENNLRTMDIPSFDVCVVAIGDDFQSSLEITSILTLSIWYSFSRSSYKNDATALSKHVNSFNPELCSNSSICVPFVFQNRTNL